MVTLHAVTYARHFARYESDFKHTLGGFRPTDDPAILEKKPDRLRIKKPESDTTLRGFLEASGVSSDHYQAVEQLNGKSLGDTIASGERIKIIIK